MALTVKRPSAKEKLLHQVRQTGGGTKRLNLDVDAETYKRMKLRAAEEDRTLAEITRGLWEEYLSK